MGTNGVVKLLKYKRDHYGRTLFIMHMSAQYWGSFHLTCVIYTDLLSWCRGEITSRSGTIKCCKSWVVD